MFRPSCVEDVIRAVGELYDSIEHIKRGVARCVGARARERPGFKRCHDKVKGKDLPSITGHGGLKKNDHGTCLHLTEDFGIVY